MNLMTGNTTRLTEACKYGSIYLRPHGQAVKTSPFHGGNTSSNLVGVTPGIFSVPVHTIEYGAIAKR